MGPIATRPIRLLVFSASLRRGSLNTRLAELAAMTLEGRGVKVDRASMREFDCPSYDLDVEEDESPHACLRPLLVGAGRSLDRGERLQDHVCHSLRLRDHDHVRAVHLGDGRPRSLRH
jgi:hypothetical protein